MDRNVLPVHNEAWKLFDKYSKDKTSEDVRAAAVGVLTAMAAAGGALLWTSGGYYFEEALRACVSGLEDAATVSSKLSPLRWSFVSIGQLAHCIVVLLCCCHRSMIHMLPMDVGQVYMYVSHICNE